MAQVGDDGPPVFDISELENEISLAAGNLMEHQGDTDFFKTFLYFKNFHSIRFNIFKIMNLIPSQGPQKEKFGVFLSAILENLNINLINQVLPDIKDPVVYAYEQIREWAASDKLLPCPDMFYPRFPDRRRIVVKVSDRSKFQYPEVETQVCMYLQKTPYRVAFEGGDLGPFWTGRMENADGVFYFGYIANRVREFKDYDKFMKDWPELGSELEYVKGEWPRNPDFKTSYEMIVRILGKAPTLFDLRVLRDFAFFFAPLPPFAVIKEGHSFTYRDHFFNMIVLVRKTMIESMAGDLKDRIDSDLDQRFVPEMHKKAMDHYQKNYSTLPPPAAANNNDNNNNSSTDVVMGGTEEEEETETTMERLSKEKRDKQRKEEEERSNPNIRRIPQGESGHSVQGTFERRKKW